MIQEPAATRSVGRASPPTRDVMVSSGPGPSDLRPPRVRATYRPRAAEIAVDPQLRRPADADYQVVGSAGTIAGRLAQGPVPLVVASPHHEEVNVVLPIDPSVPGRYPGPEIGRDQRPTKQSHDFRVVGGAGSVDIAAHAELDIISAPVLPVADVYLVPPAPADIPGHYLGPEPAANHGLQPERVEILPPVIDVRVADQVIGQGTKA